MPLSHEGFWLRFYNGNAHKCKFSLKAIAVWFFYVYTNNTGNINKGRQVGIPSVLQLLAGSPFPWNTHSHKRAVMSPWSFLYCRPVRAVEQTVELRILRWVNRHNGDHQLPSPAPVRVLRRRRGDCTDQCTGGQADSLVSYPDNKVHGANMGPIWGRQDQGGPHVGPMNFAIWVVRVS